MVGTRQSLECNTIYIQLDTFIGEAKIFYYAVSKINLG